MSKSILITGANRGIGLELARRFAAEGWQVEACCRNPAQADELQALARDSEVQVHRLDVTDAGQVRELAAALEGRPLDILLNNAGLFGPKQQGFGQTDAVQWLEVFHVNVVALQKLAEALVENLSGSTHRLIANMGSQLGSIGDNSSGGMYLYRTAKAAVSMLTRCQACDLRERGIAAVVLHPGWVRTRMGGDQAPVAPAESAQGLYDVLTRLTLEDSGRFLTFAGEELPW